MSTAHEQTALSSAARLPQSRRVAVIVIAIVLAAGVLCAAVVLIPPGAWLWSMSRQIEQTRDRLLNETDHTAVLAACREWMASVPGAHFGNADMNDPRVPVAIRGLQPTAVWVQSHRVRIECGGGFHHQGFDAYRIGAAAEDYGPDQQGVMHREVVPGLWYYEEE